MSANEPLPVEIEVQIDALVRQISVAEGLDGEIQAELRGHIEDKVRGYLSGEERVTAADALVLAKAHFGEPGVVKGMLQGVHAGAHGVSMMRRVGVVALVYMVAAGIAAPAMTALWYHLYFKPSLSPWLVETPAGMGVHESMAPWSWALWGTAFQSIPLMGAWWILRRWKRKSEGGELSIERTRDTPLILALLFALAMAGFLSNPLLTGLVLPGAYGAAVIMLTQQSALLMPPWYGFGFRVVAIVVQLGWAGLWISWCDRRPRTWRGTAIGAGTCFLFVGALYWPSQVLGREVARLWPRGNVGSGVLWRRLVEWWQFRAGVLGPVWMEELWVDLAIVLIAWGVYWMVFRRRVEVAG